MQPLGYRLIHRLLAEELSGEGGSTWPCERVDAFARHHPETGVDRCRQAVAVLVARPCRIRANLQHPQLAYGSREVRPPTYVYLKPGMNILVWCVDDMSRNGPGSWSSWFRFDVAPLRGMICCPGGEDDPEYRLSEMSENLVKHSYMWHRHAIPPSFVILDSAPMPPPLVCLARAAAGEVQVTCADPEEFPIVLGDVTYVFISFLITNCPEIYVMDEDGVVTQYPYEYYDGDSTRYFVR